MSTGHFPLSFQLEDPIELFEQCMKNEGLVHSPGREGGEDTMSSDDRVEGPSEEAGLDMESILEEIASEGEAGSDEEPRRDEDNAVIQKIADSVAHELNNVLATIIGLASVLEAEFGPDSSYGQDIEGILTASKRGMRLTRNLLGFSRDGSVAFKERIQLNDLLGKAISLLSRTTATGIEIKTDLTEELAEIAGDPSQMRHALINLAANAIDAMQGQGTLTLSTRNVTLRKEGLKSGDYVRLQVSDTGRGMDPETLKHAFDPFFTTKPQGTGSGLGLPLVNRIVRNHGGRVELFSKQGLGTTVTVFLPAIETRKPKPVKRYDSKRIEFDGKRGTILLVDDEPLVRASAKRILGLLGFSVIMAKNGKEALSRYRQHRDKIVLVLLDLIMPEMDGGEALTELKKLNPDVQVVISSGYTREEPVNKLLDRGAIAFVEKPYTVEQLANTLEDLLGPA
jgi:signal transduction histidine kinase